MVLVIVPSNAGKAARGTADARTRNASARSAADGGRAGRGADVCVVLSRNACTAGSRRELIRFLLQADQERPGTLGVGPSIFGMEPTVRANEASVMEVAL